MLQIIKNVNNGQGYSSSCLYLSFCSTQKNTFFKVGLCTKELIVGDQWCDNWIQHSTCGHWCDADKVDVGLLLAPVHATNEYQCQCVCVCGLFICGNTHEGYFQSIKLLPSLPENYIWMSQLFTALLCILFLQCRETCLLNVRAQQITKHFWLAVTLEKVEISQIQFPCSLDCKPSWR